jgi:hypothetical protein
MARKRAMPQREVDALKTLGMTCVSDNLYLQIRDQGTRSWLFLVLVDVKPKVAGFGAAKDPRWQKPATSCYTVCCDKIGRQNSRLAGLSGAPS